MKPVQEASRPLERKSLLKKIGSKVKMTSLLYAWKRVKTSKFPGDRRCFSSHPFRKTSSYQDSNIFKGNLLEQPNRSLETMLPITTKIKWIKPPTTLASLCCTAVNLSTLSTISLRTSKTLKIPIYKNSMEFQPFQTKI